MNLNKLVFFIFFIILSLEISAQAYFFDVETINVEQGLPNRRSHSIIQDLEGFIWISMPGKISRYDGYNFKSYTADFLKINESLSSYIAIDDANLLWYVEHPSHSITNESGIIDIKTNTRYDIESFSKGLIKNKSIAIIYASTIEKGAVFILTENRKFYKYSKGVFTLFVDQLSMEGYINGIKYYQFEKDVVWLSIGNYLWKIDVNGVITKYKTAGYSEEIFKINNEVICVTNENNKEQYWRIEKEELVAISSKDLLENRIAKTINKDLSLYITNEILIKNNEGEILFEYKDLEVIGNKAKQIRSETLVDKQGLIWITTENGIIKITPRKNYFNIISPQKSIRGITKLEEELYFGSYSSNKFKDSTSNIFTLLDKSSIAFCNFHQDENSRLWIGTTSDFLLKYDIKKDSLSYYHYDNNSIFLPYFNSLTNQVLIGTENGISVFDVETETFSKLKLPIDSDDLGIRQFYDDGKVIWVVSTKGLLMMNKSTTEITAIYDKKNTFPFHNFNHLYIDENNIFWIATRGNGLFRWDKSANKLDVFSRENGLSNDNIYAVYEDDYKMLWLPSDYGLNRLDKRNFDVDIFLPKDGIAHEEFNTFAHYKDEAGKLYFGGLSGITSFDPKDFRKTDFRPNLKLINIQKAEKDKPFESSILTEFTEKKRIELAHYESNLKLSLALLDYTNPGENQYAYKLEGINNEWIFTENNILTLSNLPSGRYNLLLKAKSPVGNLANEILTILIVKDVPFYQKAWFIILLLFAAILAIFLAVKWRFSKLEKDRIRLEAEVEKRTQTISKQTEALKALDKAKTQFFSNITHEFRTPLTLIIGPLEQLFNENIKSTTREKLQVIHKNANLLQGLINQLLDLSKIESGNMKIEVRHGDIIDYSKDLVEHFRGITEQKQQKLIFNSELNTWETHFDKEKWNKIIFNLLSNAIKFTPENGEIELQIAQVKLGNEVMISLKVIDNGIGIAKEKQKNIFKRFYQADGSTTRVQDGTGIGLALVKELVILQKGRIHLESEINKGSIFSILLPIPKITSVTDEIKKEEKPIKEFRPVFISNKEISIENDFENSTDSNKLELLIIEDNAEMRGYIRSCIDESIYNITEAENGEIGIQKVNDLVPDLIVSDVMMPKKDGYEVVETIRQQQSTSHIPIILLTAKSSLESRLKGLSRGADVYLTKPFSPKELTLRIHKLIEMRQLFRNKINQNTNNQVENQHSDSSGILDNTYQKENIFIKELSDYIEENIDDYEMNGETIAAHFSMSRMQLHRKLKALTNTSISLFIKKIRFKKAIELMKTQDLNISEIAYEVGFSSPAQFSKTFKKETGKTPSQFLEELKQR